MLRVIGIGAIVLCSTMTGMYMSSMLSQKVSALEDCISLMGFFAERLRFLRPSTASLIESASEMDQFSRLNFLTYCSGEMRRGVAFPVAWRLALAKNPGSIGAQIELIEPLADTLGSTGLDNQLSSLSFTRTLLEERLSAARDHRDKSSKMYRSMGILCGIALAIILL